MCPRNQRFASGLPDDSPYAAREALARRDARTQAREILGMTQEGFSRAFSKSPMQRETLRGLERNAAVVLGNVGTPDDVGLLEQARDEEPLVREHVAWALRRLDGERASLALDVALEVVQDRLPPLALLLDRVRRLGVE